MKEKKRAKVFGSPGMNGEIINHRMTSTLICDGCKKPLCDTRDMIVYREANGYVTEYSFRHWFRGCETPETRARFPESRYVNDGYQDLLDRYRFAPWCKPKPPSEPATEPKKRSAEQVKSDMDRILVALSVGPLMSRRIRAATGLTQAHLNHCLLTLRAADRVRMLGRRGPWQLIEEKK